MLPLVPLTRHLLHPLYLQAQGTHIIKRRDTIERKLPSNTTPSIKFVSTNSESKPLKLDKYYDSDRSDGSLASSTGETITTIQHHFPVRAYKNEIYTEELATTSFQELSSLEIERALAKIKSRKAPGIDKIPGEVVKEIYAANKELTRRESAEIFSSIRSSRPMYLLQLINKFFNKTSICVCEEKDETRYHLVYVLSITCIHRRKGFPKDFAVMTLRQLLHWKDFRKTITEILKKRLEMALEEQ
ncbi:hypothetical protein CDAR_540251 [Caerostris darwini]|uniref:Reverse transcriptase n=1 Tax=Caerostris darwini TaxID=1538125 RepID=A0AAV4WVH7_9ARAC|nr:hypothetical protein CDAR_540251 [Caerostris darwini]